MFRINFAKHLPVAQCRLREESRPFTESTLSLADGLQGDTPRH